MMVGTKSILFGAHQFLLHPLFVAWAWWKLYGFPWDPRLWVAFVVHDLGYWGKPNMDGPEGERHVELGARLMHWLFDLGPVFWFWWLWAMAGSALRFWHRPGRMVSESLAFVQCRCKDWWPFLCQRCGCCGPLRWAMHDYACDGDGEVDGHIDRCPRCGSDELEWHIAGTSGAWRDFSLYHSRFYARRDGRKFSRLCVADKLAVALVPAWLYLPLARATGELAEYMEAAKRRADPGEGKYASMHLDPDDPRQWYAGMCDYLRRWAHEHKDGREDTWTPSRTREGV